MTHPRSCLLIAIALRLTSRGEPCQHKTVIYSELFFLNTLGIPELVGVQARPIAGWVGLLKNGGVASFGRAVTQRRLT